MIFGNLNNIENELYFYPKAVQKGINFLLDKENWQLEPGKYQIEGNDIYAKVTEYDTETVKARHPEAHVQYIDIQCIIKGKEKIGVGRLLPAFDEKNIFKNELKENDIIRYNDIDQENFIELNQASFAVFFPWDVHRPNCSVQASPEHVKKIIVKVAARLL